MAKQRKLAGYFLAILSSTTFGMIPLFSLPVLKGGMAVSAVLFYRMFFSAIILGVYLLIKQSKFRITAKEARSVVFFGGLGYGLTAIFLFLAYHYMESGVATTIHFIYPLTIAVGMSLFFKERFSWVTFFSIVISLTGVSLLGFANGLGEVRVMGIFWVLLSVLCYTFYFIALHKSAMRHLPPLLLTFYILVSSTFVLALYCAFDGGIPAIETRESFFNLLMLSFVCTVVSNLALVWAVQKIGATLSSVLGTMEPITAVTIGVLCFGETLSWQIFAGLFLILCAVTWVILDRR